MPMSPAARATRGPGAARPAVGCGNGGFIAPPLARTRFDFGGVVPRLAAAFDLQFTAKREQAGGRKEGGILLDLRMSHRNREQDQRARFSPFHSGPLRTASLIVPESV